MENEKSVFKFLAIAKIIHLKLVINTPVTVIEVIEVVNKI